MRLATAEMRAVFGDRLDELPWPESLRGPSWATSELVAGDGRRKLTAYMDLAPPPWEPFTVAEAAAQVASYGDAEPGCLLLAEVLSQIPRIVAEYVVATTVFFFVGHTTRGWVNGVPDLEDRSWLVVVSAHDDAETVKYVIAHELAHCWNLELRAGARPALASFGLQAATSRAYQEAHPDTVAAFRKRHVEAVTRHQAGLRRRDRDEDIADALATQWGFKPPAWRVR